MGQVVFHVELHITAPAAFFRQARKDVDRTQHVEITRIEYVQL